MVSCFNCKKPFTDYKELAQHIMMAHKNDRKSRTWAANFLYKKLIFKESRHSRYNLSKQDELDVKQASERMKGKEENA